ncbi:MAG: YggS family pyridoxal phosphate-dependent enzyme [Planctomycetota bacterium JB042]
MTAIRSRMEDAARRAGRSPDEVRLVSVTKTVGQGIIRRLIDLGATDLGENRVAVAEPKIEALSGPDGPTWHLVGHLQSNKVRRAVRSFSWIHSVDSVGLLDRIDRVAREESRRPRLLLQVNVADEAQKHGVDVEALPALADRAAAADAVETVGLMAMAPFGDEPEASRRWFARLRELRDRFAPRFPGGLPHLSMGMTNDFEVAVEEGATLVRVGRALFDGVEADEAPSDGA